MAKAFAPGNLSCIFRVCDNPEPSKKHSLGVGFTVNKGVYATITKSQSTEIYFNNKKIEFPTVKTVIDSLTKIRVKVELQSELELGCGFGLSGASSLATAFALNRLFSLGKYEQELAMTAHIAEVKNSTGLGDVAGQFNGGFLMKTKIGNPLEAEILDVKEKAVYYKVFGPLHTKGILKDRKICERINSAGDNALEKIKSLVNPKFSEVIRISKSFALESGLLTDEKMLQEIAMIESHGGNASMIMLGKAVYSDIAFDGCKKLEISKNKAVCQ